MPAFTPDQIIDGKYEVLELLAEGGMSEVYKVRHLHLDELRIVKIMRSDLAREESTAERFQHEAKLASRVRHRNIASLHDFSRLDDGSFYMVSEYLDGETVQSWIGEKGRIAPDVAIDVAIQVAAGLEAIHKAGVVHRDISPDNIMIVPDEGEEQSGAFTARILDLGIAKSLHETADGGRTQTGAFVGKARYASPEQSGLLGSTETIDERSDIYSLGVTLYEMLAGVAPFDSPTPEGYLLKHIHETPAPLPEALIPVGLAQVVEKAMAKNRNDRFQTATFMREALAALRTGQEPRTAIVAPAAVRATEPVEPRNVPVVSRKRRSRLIPLFLAGIALLVLGAAWAGWRAAGNEREVDGTPRSTRDRDVPLIVAVTPAPTPSAATESDSYEIVEELPGENEAVIEADSDRQLSEVPQPAPPREVVRPSATRAPVRASPTRTVPIRSPAPRATPAPRTTPRVTPRATPVRRPPQMDRQRLSEATAVDRLLGFVSSTNYYAVRRECITTRSLGYANEGYTVEVHGGGCPGDERQRRLGVWRVDVITGEFFVRNAKGKFVEP